MKRTLLLIVAALLMFSMTNAQPIQPDTKPGSLSTPSSFSQKNFDPSFFPALVSVYVYANNNWDPNRYDRLVEILNPFNKVIERDYVLGDDFRITDRRDLSTLATTQLTEIKPGGTGDYQNYERIRQEVDGHGHHSLYVKESWINDLWQTLYGNKYSNDYDMSGHVSQSIVSNYNTNTGNYEDQQRYSHQYQADGKTSEMIVDQYASSQWEHFQRYRYMYDETGRFKKVLIDSWLEDWIFGMYSVYEYYSDGTVTVTTYTMLDGTEYPISRTTFQVDDHDNTILELHEVTDGKGGWTVYSGEKNAFSYAQNLLLEHIKQLYQKPQPGSKSGNDNWVNEIKEVFSDYVSLGIETIIPKESFQVYPNPASQQVTISSLSPSPLAGSICILDLSGKVIYFQAFPQGTNRLTMNCSRWASGTYWVCWKESSNPIQYKKLIINN